MPDDRADSVVDDAPGDDQDDAGVQPSRAAAVRGQVADDHRVVEAQAQATADRHRRQRLTGRLVGVEQRAGGGARAGRRRAAGPTARPTAGRGRRRPRRAPSRPTGQVRPTSPA